MRPDSRQSLDQHDAEQPTAPRDTQQASSCALSPKREGALSMLRVPELVEQCRQEMQAYRRGEYSHDEYGLELLHRAIMQGQQEAWAGLERCLGELVRGWLYTHPYRELVLRWESEESYVALAFERFWQATVQQQVAFRTFAGALAYLRAGLNGVPACFPAKIPAKKRVFRDARAS